MIPIFFKNRLKTLRLEHGIDQRTLAARAGLALPRVSDFELGTRVPCAENVVQLASALGVGVGDLTDGTDWISTEDRATLRDASLEVVRQFRRAFSYDPPCERTMAVQVRKALAEFPNVTRQMLRTIAARPDGKRTLRLLSGMLCGSSHEALVHLGLLVAGATVVKVAPLAVGFRHRATVDPSTREGVGDCPRLAYFLWRGDLRLIVFPQLTLACGRLWTVDFICGVVRGRGRVRWFVLEVDGPGHDPAWDAQRQEQIALPTVRLYRKDLFDEDLIERILPRIPGLGG